MIPIVIGVTGHRDIPAKDIATLKTSIRSRLDGLMIQFLDSNFVMYNGLAIGADEIFFEVAQEFSRISIRAALPFNVDEYRKDFTALQEKQAFEKRLASFIATIDTSSGQELMDRDQGYVNLGRFLIEKTQILFCLWDGVSSETPAPGGTAHVIQMATSAVQRNISLEYRDLPQVEHLFVVRTKSAVEFVRANEVQIGKWLPQPKNNEIQNTLKQIDSFNRRSKNLAEPALVQSKSYLYDGQPKQNDGVWHSDLEEVYARADVLASMHQKWRIRGVLLVSTVAFFAIVSMQIFQNFGHHNFWIGTYFVLSVIAILAFFYLFRGTASHEKNYLDWRSLAEGVRVQNFWQLTGVHAKVSDNYLVEDSDDIAWLRTAIKNIEPDAAPQLQKGMLDFVKTIWIGGQQRYFARQSKRNHAFNLKYRRLILLSLILGILAAVGLAAAHFSNKSYELVDLFGFISGLCFLLAASFKAYSSQIGFSILARKYQAMASVMERAKIQLGDASERADWISCQAILVKTGQYALAENTTWLRSHRERQFEVSIS